MQSTKTIREIFHHLFFHGLKNGIEINGDFITLEQIADEFKGKFENKIIHFGSCNTFNIPENQIREFMKKTGAIGVSGYQKEIDFISSTVVDILYFEMCQNYKTMLAIERNMFKNYKELCEVLKFKMYY